MLNSRVVGQNNKWQSTYLKSFYMHIHVSSSSSHRVVFKKNWHIREYEKSRIRYSFNNNARFLRVWIISVNGPRVLHDVVQRYNNDNNSNVGEHLVNFKYQLNFHAVDSFRVLSLSLSLSLVFSPFLRRSLFFNTITFYHLPFNPTAIIHRSANSGVAS